LINLIIHIIVQHIAGLYIIYVYSCKLVVATGKREEEATSSSGLLGLELKGKEERVRCTLQAQQMYVQQAQQLMAGVGRED